METVAGEVLQRRVSKVFGIHIFSDAEEELRDLVDISECNCSVEEYR